MESAYESVIDDLGAASNILFSGAGSAFLGGELALFTLERGIGMEEDALAEMKYERPAVVGDFGPDALAVIADADQALQAVQALFNDKFGEE